MVSIKPAHLQIVMAILKDFAPECEVRVFGSRFTGKVKDYSDLDLVLLADTPLGWKRMARIEEAFQDSILPYRVDVLDWYAISPQFQKVIEESGFEVIQTKKQNL